MRDPTTDDQAAIAFAHAWAEAWNRRDIAAVLAHFDDAAVFVSPVARRIGFSDDGVVRGKDALRRYWEAALARNPGLRFEVTAVYRGIGSLTIAFRNQQGVARVEVLIFTEGRVVSGHGMFVADPEPGRP
jgi:ketosteroid isomerase-like protein